MVSNSCAVCDRCCDDENDAQMRRSVLSDVGHGELMPAPRRARVGDVLRNKYHRFLRQRLLDGFFSAIQSVNCVTSLVDLFETAVSPPTHPLTLKAACSHAFLALALAGLPACRAA